MTAFKYFSAAVWLSFCMLVPTVTGFINETGYIFRTNLVHGIAPYIESGSGITWVTELINPSQESCDMQGIIRLPFSSSSCYRFSLWLYKPTGFNFHIANGCGDGWGGSYKCYEVHNYKKNFFVYGTIASRYSTHVDDVIGTLVAVTIEKGKVKFESGGIIKTFYNPTLFTSSYVYFSMNRVYNLKAFPNPLRVAKGLCAAYIYTC